MAEIFIEFHEDAIVVERGDDPEFNKKLAEAVRGGITDPGKLRDFMEQSEEVEVISGRNFCG